MRWRPHPEEEYPRSHWEQLVRTIIERIGLEQLCEIIESVVVEMREEDRNVAAARSHRPAAYRSVAEASRPMGFPPTGGGGLRPPEYACWGPVRVYDGPTEPSSGGGRGPRFGDRLGRACGAFGCPDWACRRASGSLQDGQPASGPPSRTRSFQTAKLNDVDPQAWLADVLARIPDISQTRLSDLLPWNWRQGAPMRNAA